jgi:hypothetical protein
VSLIDRARGVSSEEIWSYPIRTLTERFTVIERVAPRFDSALTVIYNVKRFLQANTMLVLISSDARSTIGCELNDLMPSATLTRVDDTGFVDTRVKDYNDATFETTTLTDLPGYATRIIAYWDLGSVGTRLFYIVVSSTSVSVSTLIDVSPDLTTWTNVCGAQNATSMCAGSGSFRYIRYRIHNPSAGGANPSNATRVHTIEIFNPDVKRLRIPISNIYTLKVISAGYSNLLEVIPY